MQILCAGFGRGLSSGISSNTTLDPAWDREEKGGSEEVLLQWELPKFYEAISV